MSQAFFLLFKQTVVTKLLISTVLLGWLITQTNWQQLWSACKPLSINLFIFCICIYLVCQWFSALRWQLVANALGFNYLPISCYFQLYLKGMFYNQFLPGTIGGDGYRILQLSHISQLPNRLSVISILAERGLGLASLLYMTALGAYFAPQLPSGIKQALLGLVILSLIGYGILWFLPAQVKGLAWFLPAKQLAHRLEVVSLSVGLSLLIQMGMIVIHWMLAKGLGLSVSFIYIAITYGCVVLLTLLPISMNGFGLREVGYVQLLRLVGVSASQAVALSLTWFLVGLLVSLLGSLPQRQLKLKYANHHKPCN